MKRFLPFVLFFCVSALLGPSLLSAQEPKNIPGVSARLEKLARDLEFIEKNQQELVRRQDQVIEEIKNLKIAVRR